MSSLHTFLDTTEQKVFDYEQALQRQAELSLQQDKIKQEQRELKKHFKDL